jgi:hypothetical protein
MHNGVKGMAIERTKGHEAIKRDAFVGGPYTCRNWSRQVVEMARFAFLARFLLLRSN